MRKTPSYLFVPLRSSKDADGMVVNSVDTQHQVTPERAIPSQAGNSQVAGRV
jgi:hypothetical protein